MSTPILGMPQEVLLMLCEQLAPPSAAGSHDRYAFVTISILASRTNAVVNELEPTSATSKPSDRSAEPFAILTE